MEADCFFITISGAGDDVLIFLLGEAFDDFLGGNGRRGRRDRFRSDSADVMFRGRREGALLSGLSAVGRNREDKCAEKKSTREHSS